MVNTGDTAWLLMSCALVMLMTMPGVALFYGGLVRRKNVLSMIMMAFIVLCMITIQWILFGYSLAFGQDHWHFIGNLDWFALQGVGLTPNPEYAKTIPHLLYMSFQMMFAVITPALISGALAERMKFSAYLIFILFWSTFVYDPIAHWVWGTHGFLKDWGVLDFAGGTVVHITSGITGLVCALVLGKRRGYGREPMPPHNLPFTMLGGALLWFGWFGFNGGSALAANELAVLAVVVTNIATAAAGLTWIMLEWMITGRPTVLGGITGTVAGLVCITPAAGYVSPLSAILFGIIVSVVCYIAVANIKQKMGYDDSLDAFGLHGIGGIVGALLTGIFANTAINAEGADGLLFGNPQQLLLQLVGVLVVIIYTTIVSYVLLKIIDKLMGLRVNPDDELIGLDLTQHEENAYTLID